MENRRGRANIRPSLQRRKLTSPPGAVRIGSPGSRGAGAASGGRTIEATRNWLPRLTVLSLILCLVSAAGAAADLTGPAGGGGEFVVRDVSLRKKSRELAADFRVSGAFDREVEETIQSGLPRTISFRLELYRPRLLLPDRRLRTWRLDHTIRYDNLKDEFLITRSVTADDGGAPRQLPPILKRGLPDASAAAAQVDGFPIPLAESPTPVRYLVRIRARMEPLEEGSAAWIGRIPVPLIPAFGHRKSDWYVQEFEF